MIPDGEPKVSGVCCILAADSEPRSLATHHASILTSRGHSKNDRGFLRFNSCVNFIKAI